MIARDLWPAWVQDSWAMGRFVLISIFYGTFVLTFFSGWTTSTYVISLSNGFFFLFVFFVPTFPLFLTAINTNDASFP